MSLFLRLIITFVLFVSVSGCTKAFSDFSKGLAGEYCQETVYVLDADTDTYVETCKEVVED